MREWINKRLDDLGKNKAGLARHLNIPFPRVSEMISGKRRIQQDEIQPFAQFMEMSSEQVVEYFATANTHHENLGTLAGANVLSIPLLSWVSAGALQETATLDDLEHVTYVDGRGLDPSGDWIALRVEGRSMDKISPHDSIIFVNRKEKTLVPNGCYIISDGNGGATYKRFRPPNIFEPVSTKPDEFETIKFDPGSEPEVIGRVRGSFLSL